jgi:hypothetical protein
MRRRLTVLVSVLGLTISIFLAAAAGPVLAKQPPAKQRPVDVRGTWELTWKGVDKKTQKRWTLHATAVIREEDPQTGEFRGDYDIPDQEISTGTYKAYHNKFSGKVKGSIAHLVGIDGEGEAIDVKLQGFDTQSRPTDGSAPAITHFLKLEGALKKGGITLAGTLEIPAPPQSLDGGDRPSSTAVNCMPVLGADGETYRCLVSVADESSRGKPTRPTGKITLSTGPDGRTQRTVEDSFESACDLVKPTDGTRYTWTSGSGLKRGSFCLLDAAVAATAAAGPDGNVPVITVEYAGDKHFGPSEASWFAPARSVAATPDAGATDPLGQLIGLALEVGAMAYQMQLDIGGALEP